MRVRVVAGVALALVAVALVVVLSSTGPRLAGTNGIKLAGFPVEVPPQRTVCQPTTVVDDAAAVGLLVGTFGRPVPPLEVSFRAPDGREVARGEIAGGREGSITVPLDRTVDGAATAVACVRNDGRARVALGGDFSGPDLAATIGRRATGGVMGLRYERAGDESWWQLLPTIATRFGVGKAGLFGSWTLPFAVLLLAGAWVVAIRLLLRGGRA